MMSCIKACPQGYPPGKPDIGTAIHHATAATGTNMRTLIFVIVFLIIVAGLLGLLYATRHMGEGEDYDG